MDKKRTPTGRKPTKLELQELPLRTEMGKKFRENFKTEMADINYSEIEARILAGRKKQ